MTNNESGPARVPARPTQENVSHKHSTESFATGQYELVRATLLAMLAGANYVNARRDKGVWSRIRLLDNPDKRAALVDMHLHSRPTTLDFFDADGNRWRECVAAVELAGFLPAADGRLRWIAFDLDAADHGGRGLADPDDAARCLAERADNAGLLDGLLTVRSRGGRGIHLYLLPPKPILIDSAVLVTAALAGDALRVAKRDVADYSAPHAFRRATGEIARAGDAGAFEVFPPSDDLPSVGWSLALPFAGFANRADRRPLDPLTLRPTPLEHVPRCRPDAWAQYVHEVRERPRRDQRARSDRDTWRERPRQASARAVAFMDGRVLEGERNREAFRASCDLLRTDIGSAEAERLILVGAERCGLPRREARRVFASARKRVRP